MISSDTQIFPGLKLQLYLIFLAAIQFIGLTFGEGNQVEQFSIIARLLEPSFASNDFFLNSAAELGQPRYYYSLIIAGLTKLAPLAVIINFLMFINGWALGLLTFIASRQLLKSSETAAALASTLALLNLGISIGHAGYLNFSNFQPASIAITASLAGILALTNSRFAVATALFLFSLVVHPTIGAETGVLGFAAVLLTFIFTAKKIRWSLWAVSIATFLAGLILFWALPNLGDEGIKITQAEFYSILIETRAPHHYLGLDFPKRRWLEALIFIFALAAIAYQCLRLQVPVRGLVLLITLISFVVILCAASLYFVDIAESRVWATAQLFRLVFLIKWAAYLLLGLLACRWFATGQAHAAILATITILATADSMSYALIAALATQFAISVLRLNNKLSILATLPAIAFFIYHHLQYGSDEQLLRMVIACAALLLLQLRYWPVITTAASIVLVISSLSISYFGTPTSLIPDKLRTILSIEERLDDQAQIAKLARSIGDESAIWLIPPNLEQFRFIAARAVVVDFTSIPFTDGGLQEWNKRMKALYGETDQTGFKALQKMLQSYRSAPSTDLAHERFGADYAVLFADTPVSEPVLANAGRYKIIKLGN